MGSPSTSPVPPRGTTAHRRRRASVWDGKWHHAAGTFDGPTVRLFIDGVRVGTAPPSSTAIAYNPPDGGGLIGDYGGDCDLFFVGDIDGVQIWSRALRSPTSGAS